MSTSTLHAQIEALSNSLKATRQLDAKGREALTSLRREIEDALHRQGTDSLKERLEQLAVRFENDHPAAGTVLRQAIDALAKAGM